MNTGRTDWRFGRLAMCLAAAGMVATSPAQAQQTLVDTSRWVCALCPYHYGWYGELYLGASWVSNDSLRFADYRGLEEEGGYLAFDGEAHWRDENGNFLDIYGKDVGLQSRRIYAQGGRRGRYRLSLAYQEMPKFRGFGAETPFLGAGGSDLSLPQGWQSAPTTSEMTGLASALHPTTLDVSRKTFNAGLRWKLGPGWTYEVSVGHQEKDGTRPFGGGVFTLNTSHLPAPVDFSTQTFDMGLNFSGDRSSWRFGIAASEFDNGRKSLTWANPFEAIEGTEVLRASLEPDNSFYQASVSGAFAFSPAVRLSGHAAWGRMEQDDALLPWSINPQFSELPLPRLTADTRIDVGTFNLSGKLTARLARGLDVTAKLRRDERDNKTPVDIWVPVVTDFIQRDARPNRPYSFERDRASLSLAYRPHSAVRLQAGAEREDFERSLQSVLETEERSYFAEANLSPGSIVDLRARLESSDRKAGPYIEVDTLGLVEHPLMRKFHLADRDRDRLRIDVDVYPLPELMLTLSFSEGKEDYDQSLIGLHHSETRNVGLDLSWAAGEDWSVFGWVNQDQMDASLSGAENPTAAPWIAITEDEFLTAGLGANIRVNERVSFGFDLVSSESEGDIRTMAQDDGGPFPTLRTDLRSFRAHLDYYTRPQWTWKFYVEHEKYDSSDWAMDGFGPGTVPVVLTFGAESPDYSVTVLRVQGVFQFE